MIYFTFLWNIIHFWSGLRHGHPVYCCIEFILERGLRYSCIFDFLIYRVLQKAYNQFEIESKNCVFDILTDISMLKKENMVYSFFEIDIRK